MAGASTCETGQTAASPTGRTEEEERWKKVTASRHTQAYSEQNRFREGWSVAMFKAQIPRQVDVTNIAKNWTPPQPVNVRCALYYVYMYTTISATLLFVFNWRYRKMKERLGLTEIRKHANRMTFAEVGTNFCSSPTVCIMLLKHVDLWLTCFFSFIICMIHLHLMLYIKTKSRSNNTLPIQTLDPMITLEAPLLQSF